MSASTDPRSASTDRVPAAHPTIPVPRTVVDDASAPYLQSVDQVVLDTGADLTRGLSHREAARRLQENGPNRLTAEKPPSTWSVALAQLRDPMNLMLIAVAVASLLIAQFSTAVLVAALVLLNVLLGARQELKARASVDALSKLQVPQTRALREGQLEMVPA
jgi:P-type Ca2+ transporter type 2C